MKKTMLFVIDSLDVAGAEKSLVTLLSMIDYTKYEVDLQLFAYGHELEKLVPKEVNILKPLKYTSFTNLSFKKSVQNGLMRGNFNMLLSRIKYSATIRNGRLSNPQKAIVFWKNAAKVIENNPKNYDIAISYAQGIPTYYVADKITATIKLTWVNVSYEPDEMVKQYQKKYYAKFNRIIVVSHSTKEVFLNAFPEFSDRTEILYDINHPGFITKMSKLDEGFGDEFDGIRLLTIGRLAHQKGYDIALEACRKLKEEGIHFRWYILGKGPQQSEIEDKIKQYDLKEHFILMGVKANPYPYIRESDIYVQTSRFEGFGLAIAEARMLNIPVVTSKFDAVYNQMIHEKNGLVVDRNIEAVTNGIKRLLKDQELRNNIVHYLRNEKKGNAEEIDTFYKLINIS